MATAPDRGKAQTLQMTQYGQREAVFKRDVADRTLGFAACGRPVTAHHHTAMLTHAGSFARMVIKFRFIPTFPDPQRA
jgi:hypothetical protein